jgi:RHS repeat-associated protein
VLTTVSVWDYDNLNQKFTGKERDQESGLDYFGARYYGSALGRFTRPDDPLVDQHVSDPQSWNLYAYVRNNPLKNTDPFGLDCITTSDASSSSVTVTTERGGSADTCSGTYVNGTVNVNSYSYNGSNLSWSDNSEWGGGAMNFVFGSTASSNSDWGPGSGNMLGARQIGMTAPIGEALGYATGGVMLGAGAGIAYGAWAGGSALTALSIPAATLPPAVSNPTLRNIVDELFQVTDKLPGGTAGAVRYERLTGDLLSPSGHFLKAEQTITALTNLLKSGKLSFNDQITARQLIQELGDALKTQPRR